MKFFFLVFLIQNSGPSFFFHDLEEIASVSIFFDLLNFFHMKKVKGHEMEEMAAIVHCSKYPRCAAFFLVLWLRLERRDSNPYEFGQFVSRTIVVILCVEVFSR